jgi:hypothetical protein
MLILIESGIVVTFFPSPYYPKNFFNKLNKKQHYNIFFARQRISHTFSPYFFMASVVSSLNVNLIRSTSDRINKCKPGDHFSIVGIDPMPLPPNPPPTQRDVCMAYFRLSLIIHPDRHEQVLAPLPPLERNHAKEAAEKAFKMLADSKSFLCGLSKIKFEEERTKARPVFAEPKTGEFSPELFAKTFSSHVVRERNPRAYVPRAPVGMRYMSPQYNFVAGGMKVTSPQERARVFVHPIPIRPKQQQPVLLPSSPLPAQVPQPPTMSITQVMSRSYGCSTDQTTARQQGVQKCAGPRAPGISQATKDKVIRQVLNIPLQSSTSLSVWN